MARIQEKRKTDGTTSFHVTVRLKGHKTMSATFDRKTDAKKWIQKQESDLRTRRHFPLTVEERHTVGELIARYIDEELPKKAPTTQASDRCRLQWWQKEYGHLFLRDFTADCLEEAKQKIRRSGRGNSPSSVQHYLMNISHVLTKAVKWKWLLESPMRQVEKEASSTKRVRFLEEAELAKLLEACRQSKNQSLFTAVLLSVYTGLRRSELLGLNWQDVDLLEGRISLGKTKNGDPRIVWLPEVALQQAKEFAKERRAVTSLLFPGKDLRRACDFRTAFENAVIAAGLKDFHWHDLRHSCASFLLMRGVKLDSVGTILGHRSLATTKRYAHLSDQYLKREHMKIGNLLDKVHE